MTRRSTRVTSSRTQWLIGVFLIVGVSWAVRYWAGLENAAARPPVSPPTRQGSANSKGAHPGGTPQGEQKQPIVALVNGQTIMRDELAKECLRLYGEEVLESITNRKLIDGYCRQQGISVTDQEIDEEIDRLARKFSLPTDQYLKMLEKERGIKPMQYGKDVIWPTLALRKLAAPKLTVSKQELAEAYDSQFGPAVKARMIVLDDEKQAREVLAKAVAKPGEFGVLARNYSKDVNSASANGLIQPIRRHLGDPEIEKAAFELQEGEISRVIPVGNQFAILKCEGFLEPVKADRKHFDAVLTEAIKDRKLRAAAAEMFKTLQEKAGDGKAVQNVMNDPALSKEMPGVAAMINGEPITLAELGDHCIERHGKDVLDGVLNRRLLEQTLKRKKLTVTDADIDGEISRAAISMGKMDKSGRPDLQGWLQLVTETQGISEATYIHDVVWPSAAMKKIVGDTIKVAEEDMKKGFEANYGPRVRCRMIMFNDQRNAQKVWDMARQDLTVKKFGDLAEQYSIEANSRSLRGEIPPIQKWGGQPVLEKAAFELQPGELSGVIQVGPNYVILLCEGYTTPVNVKFATVKEQLYADILEKKHRLAMADTFEKIKAEATIDNYLAGTSQSPKREKELLEQDLLEQKAGPVAKRPAATVRSAPKR